MVPIKQRLSDFTPIICRLLARTGKRRAVRVLTDGEIIVRSGLEAHVVWALSWYPTWEGVQIKHAFAYMQGCGIDFMDGRSMDVHSKYMLRDPKFTYLKKHPDWMPRWLKMIELQRKYNESANTTK